MGKTWYFNEKKCVGVWYVFTDLPKVGELYKYNVKQANGREIFKMTPLHMYLKKNL
uniref:CAZy families CBM48/GH13 protein n=1 Tax=uncultured Streptococcus sp. TaxID=83427 RepID=A0A060BX83_9STRE|nr:CAZy families CBM48/GH13 protein [uncultured Streptococcus sp.]